MPILLVVVIRSFFAFFILLVLIRLIGKQQISQLTFFDYILGITIGSMASTLSVQVNENSLATISGMTVWSILSILLAITSLKSKWLQKLVEGKATVVVQSGHILDKNLRKIRVSFEAMLSELRNQGVFNIEDVEYAVFEPNGKLSVQKKSQKQPVTPSDLSIGTQYDGMPSNLIIDGSLQEDTLKKMKLSRAWLQFQLRKQNIAEIERVTLAQLDTKGNLFVDLKDENKTCIISTNE